MSSPYDREPGDEAPVAWLLCLEGVCACCTLYDEWGPPCDACLEIRLAHEENHRRWLEREEALQRAHEALRAKHVKAFDVDPVLDELDDEVA